MGSVPLISHVDATEPVSTGLIIPLYIYPGSAWNAILQEKESNPGVPMTVVANPANGPGSSVDPNYQSWIVALRDAGVNVIGYVATGYGSVTTSSAESQILAYKEMYSVNGIFLDEMSNVNGYQSYYSKLTSYAHSLGLSLVVGNPGTSVPSSFFGTVDQIVIYESPGLPSTSTLSSSTSGGTSSEFAVISYDIGQLTSADVSQLSAYASSIYITNGVSPDPYSSLPSYFSALVSDLASLDFPSLTVQAVSAGGSPVSGIMTTVESNGQVVSQGYAPLTFAGVAGAQYAVTVANSASEVFSHWQDGTTNQTYTLTLTSATTLTASFSSVSSITVDSVNQNGAAISGYYAALYNSADAQLATGFTPVTFTGTVGQSYSVEAESYGSCAFTGWSDGVTNDPMSITPSSSAITYTAEYDCAGTPSTSTITVTTVDGAGATIDGYYVTLWQGGTLVSGCFSTCSFTVNDGQTYQVIAASYGSETFSHWENNGATGSETVNVPSTSTTISLTAVYTP